MGQSQVSARWPVMVARCPGANAAEAGAQKRPASAHTGSWPPPTHRRMALPVPSTSLPTVTVPQFTSFSV